MLQWLINLPAHIAEHTTLYCAGTAVLCFLITSAAILHSVFKRLVSWYGSVCLLTLCAWYSLRGIARVAVFPGSAYLWKRNLEASFRSDFAGKLLAYVVSLRVLIIHVYHQAKAGAPTYILSQGKPPRLKKNLANKMFG